MLPEKGYGPDAVTGISLGGLTLRGLDYAHVLRPEPGCKHVVTVNAEAIVIAQADPRFRAITNGACSCLDGQITLWLAKVRNPGAALEKVSGSDLIFRLVERRHRIFLLGASEASNLSSVEALSRETDVDGFSPPTSPYPFADDVDAEILRRIERFAPDTLLVAFGMPKQEFWIDDHRERLARMGVRLAVGVGGTLEFVSGAERRAPGMIQRWGLESIWRLSQNPRRIRRLLRATAVFRHWRR